MWIETAVTGVTTMLTTPGGAKTINRVTITSKAVVTSIVASKAVVVHSRVAEAASSRAATDRPRADSNNSSGDCRVPGHCPVLTDRESG